jgi:hypothetical protein
MVFGVLPFVMNFYFACSTTIYLLVNTVINSFCKKVGLSWGTGMRCISSPHDAPAATSRGSRWQRTLCGDALRSKR